VGQSIQSHVFYYFDAFIGGVWGHKSEDEVGALHHHGADGDGNRASLGNGGVIDLS